MQLHTLKPSHARKRAKKIGRGGKRGTYSGKGIKGQKARAGANIRPALRDLIKKLPKRRGVYFKSIHTKPACVNLGDLERHFGSGAAVNPAALVEKSLVSLYKGRYPKIKILSDGALTKKFFVSGCAFSKAAKEKIEKAGGKIE